MITIQHDLVVEAPAATVYQAIATAEGISTWWDKQTPRQTERGLVLDHHPGPEHGTVSLLVLALVPDQRVEWECVSTHPSSSPASAWTGTHFVFTMMPRGEHRTELRFEQIGYDDRSRFRDANTQAWRQVLEHLKRVVESRAT